MSWFPTPLEAALASRRGAAGVIAGPLRSGKTAMIDALERRARATGWLTFRVSCSFAGPSAPQSTVRTLFAPAAVGLHTVEANADAAARHCASITTHAPLALFVDNAQWADRASLEVLARLAKRAGELPILIVLAALPASGHDVGAIVGIDPFRIAPRGTRDDADAAWTGVRTGALTADVCASLARNALREDPRSLNALRTLVFTDRVTEARDGLARVGADPLPRSTVGTRSLARDPAVSLLAAEQALRVGWSAHAEGEALRAFKLGAKSRDVLIAALISRGACREARAVLAKRDAPATLLLAESQFDAAAAAARADGRRCTSQGKTNPAIAGWRSMLALALACAGQMEMAVAVADDEVALARAFGAPTALARALYVRCVAEQDLEERAALAASVLAIDTPATLLHAIARVELGIGRLRPGEPNQGAQTLAAAAAIAATAGASD